MSDPKWATDIANKKPLLSYDLWAGTESFSDTGSSTTATSTAGTKRETIYGHTNRNHIFTPGTFTGAISFVKNFLSSLMLDGLVGVLWGGKNETITNSDSNKIIGSKKRVRVGYRFGNYQNWIGKAFSELWWKEERVTIGDRIDTIKGDIQTVVVNGEEKKIFNNTDKSTWRKIVLKSLGIPAQNWEGLTYSTTNAATGYSFATDKSYVVSATGASGDQYNTIQFIASKDGASAGDGIKEAHISISGSDGFSAAEIAAGEFSIINDNNTEKIRKKKCIKSGVVNVSCKESLNLGVSRSTIRIKPANVEISTRVDLGGPGIEVDEHEKNERLEQERLERERFELERKINEEILKKGLEFAEPKVRYKEI
jgi:hypothetical protein